MIILILTAILLESLFMLWGYVRSRRIHPAPGIDRNFYVIEWNMRVIFFNLTMLLLFLMLMAFHI